MSACHLFNVRLVHLVAGTVDSIDLVRGTLTSLTENGLNETYHIVALVNHRSSLRVVPLHREVAGIDVIIRLRFKVDNSTAESVCNETILVLRVEDNHIVCAVQKVRDNLTLCEEGLARTRLSEDKSVRKSGTLTVIHCHILRLSIDTVEVTLLIIEFLNVEREKCAGIVACQHTVDNDFRIADQSCRIECRNLLSHKRIRSNGEVSTLRLVLLFNVLDFFRRSANKNGNKCRIEELLAFVYDIVTKLLRLFLCLL